MTEEKIPLLGARAVVLIFLLALAVRLAAIAAVGFQTLRFGDARAYLFAAQELVRTGHDPLATEPFYFRAPGYPVFLVAATLGHADRIALAKIANAVLGALAVLLIAGLSARLFRRRRLALVTGTAAALHPGFVFLSTDIQSEPLFLLLLLAAGWLLLVSTDRPSSNLALFAGAAAGLDRLDGRGLLYRPDISRRSRAGGSSPPRRARLLARPSPPDYGRARRDHRRLALPRPLLGPGPPALRSLGRSVTPGARGVLPVTRARPRWLSGSVRVAAAVTDVFPLLIRSARNDCRNLVNGRC